MGNFDALTKSDVILDEVPNNASRQYANCSASCYVIIVPNICINMWKYVEIKCQLDATDDFYCRSYCLLNMFRGTTVPIIRSSRVLYRLLLPVVFGAVKMEIVICKLADVVFSASVVRYILLLWGMSGAVGAVCGYPS